MNKLAIILPIYQRHQITTLCLRNLWHQWSKYGIEVFVVGSEGEQSKELVEHFGFNYLEYENNPLSEKLNAILEKTKGYDGVILMGSDNFISDSVIEYYQTVDCSVNAMYGFDDLHFYSTTSNLLATKSSYNSMKMSVGVGRLFTKELLKSSGYRLWRENLNRGLDNSCYKTVLSLKSETIKIKYTSDYFILDVKDELNISDPAVLKTCRKKCELDLLKKYIPYIADDILRLKTYKKITRMKTLKQNPIKKQRELVKIEIIKDIAGMKVGDTRSVTKAIASKAVSHGWAKIVTQPVQEVITIKPVKEIKQEIKMIKPVNKESYAEKLEKSLEKKSPAKNKTVKKGTGTKKTGKKK